MYITLILIVLAIVFLAVLILQLFFRKKRTLQGTPLVVKKLEHNPLLSPQEHNSWEACGVFNPASYQDDQNNVHILYRAVGHDGVSRVGYAKSTDGRTIDERHSYPIFFLENIRGLADWRYRYDPTLYPSGGSWGGVEDPRIVKIEDTLYLTFNAFDGWDFIRIGVSSIKEKDFLQGKWNWKKPFLISPPNEIHKNWVLFPEKINGKFALLHSISPTLQIDYVDRLEDLAQGKSTIQSVFNRPQERASWDTWLRGAGCPPLRTEQGWLVLYHAIEKHESHKYKVGALLLDLKNPSKILARSPGPLLSPDCWYEDDEKPGIVYVCGAVIRDGDLYMYYGGGDKHTCVAHVPLKNVLAWLVPEK